MVFGDDDTFPIHVECMDDAQHLGAGKTVRYALVVSIETAEQTSTTIHDEVRARLRQQARDRARTGTELIWTPTGLRALNQCPLGTSALVMVS